MYCLHVQTAKFDISPITHNYWDKLRLNYILNNWVITIRGSGGRSSPEARGYFNAKNENFITRKNFFGGLVGGYIPPIPLPGSVPASHIKQHHYHGGGGAKNLCTPAYFLNVFSSPSCPPPTHRSPTPLPSHDSFEVQMPTFPR